MKKNASSRKTKIMIVIVAIMLVVAVLLVIIFLKDKGTTQATVEKSSKNSEQTQQAEKQENNEDKVETDNNNEVVQQNTNNQDINENNTEIEKTTSNNKTSTKDTIKNVAEVGNTTITTEKFEKNIEENLNMRWDTIGKPTTQLLGTKVLKPNLDIKLEAEVEASNKDIPNIANKGDKINYTIVVSNKSEKVDAKKILVTDILPEGSILNNVENDGKYNEATKQITWTVDVEKGKTIDLKISVIANIMKGNIANCAVVDGEYTNTIETEVRDTVAPVITTMGDTFFERGIDIYSYPEAGGKITDNYDGIIDWSNVNMHWYKMNADGSNGEEVFNIGFKGWGTTLTNVDFGTYIITYDIKDKAGNVGHAQRKMTIRDTVNPIWEYPTNTTHSNTKLNVKAKDVNFDYISVTNQDTKKSTKYNTDEINLTEEGTYYLVAYDKAENKSEGLWLAVDKTNPKITGFDDGKSYNGYVDVNVFDKFLTTVSIQKDGKEIEKFDRNSAEMTVGTNNENFTFTKKYSEEGTYVIKGIDKVGNISTKKFIIDKTKPKYVTLGIARNKDEIDTRDQKYAKTGDSVRVLMSFAEKLSIEPKVTINGKEYDCTYRPLSSNAEANSYYYMTDITVTEDMNLPEGEIKFKVSKYADEAGNVGDELSNENINMAKYPKVIYDKTTPKIKIKDDSIGTDPYFSKVSFDFLDNFEVCEYEINGNKKKFIPAQYSNANYHNIKDYLKEGNNKIILRDKAGNETKKEFTIDWTAPNINVKDGNNENDGTAGTEAGYSRISFKLYDANKVKECKVNGKSINEKMIPDIYSDANWLNIKKFVKKGENEITVTDLAGNVTAKKFNIEEKAPIAKTLGILNLDHFSKGNPTYAKFGDTIRFYISFEEKLIGMPKVTVAGNTYEFRYDEGASKPGNNKFVYMKDLKIDDKVNLGEGKIKFNITDYKNEYGNTGKELTDEDTNYPGYMQVIYDKTKPEYTQLGILNDSHYTTGDKKYAKTGDKLRIYIGFAEKLLVEPKVIINDTVKATATYRQASATSNSPYVYLADITITDDMNLKEGVLKLKVEGYEDMAGNTEEVLTNKNINIPDYPYVIYDRTAPEVKLTYSNGNDKNMTNKDVIATLEVNEYVKDIPGWTRKDEKKFEKIFSKNEKGYLIIEDRADNSTKVWYEVKRIDKEAPIIDLTKTKSTFEVGVDTYKYPENISIWDSSDKEISVSKLNIQWFKAQKDGSRGEKVNNFEWNTNLKDRELGDYYIYYYISDKAGNKAEAHRILKLQDTTKPTITLKGKEEEHVKIGTKYTDSGFDISDNRDVATDITVNKVITWYSIADAGEQEVVDKINPNKEGRYNIVYTAIDRAGNKQTVTRLVYVDDPNELSLEEPQYTSTGSTEVTVSIKANKKIKLPEGWKFTDIQKTTIEKVYTENTDIQGEDLVISDIRGKTKKVNIKIDTIKKIEPVSTTIKNNNLKNEANKSEKENN